MTRHAATGADGDGGDTFAYAAISAETGEVLAEHDLGSAAGDPLQLAGTTGPNGVLYQGTVGPIMRITAQEGNCAPGGVEP